MPSPQVEDSSAALDEYAVLKISAVKKGRFDQTQHKRLPDQPAGAEMLEVRALLLTRGNTPELVGDACIVTSTRPKLLLSDLSYLLGVRKDKLNPRFLLHTLLSNFGRSQIEADARGSSESMVKVSQSHIREWLVLLPMRARPNRNPEIRNAITRLIRDQVYDRIQNEAKSASATI